MDASYESLRILLTGATGGIGLAAAKALRARGAELFVHGRNAQKAEALRAELAAGGARVRALVADLSSLAETARLAGEVASAGGVDVLINNAGVGFGKDGKKRELSRDGFELRFAVNYLAPFLLSEELLGRKAVRHAIVSVASVGQQELDFSDLMSARRYSGVDAYRRSKLALIMMSFDLAALHPGLQVHALHPGTYLDSTMVREAGITPLGPVSKGAESIVSVLDAVLAEGESGRYFDQSRPARPLAQAYDAGARRKLREASLELVAPFRIQNR